MNRKNLTLYLFVAIMVLAAFLRFHKVTERGPIIVDEATYMMVARTPYYALIWLKDNFTATVSGGLDVEALKKYMYDTGGEYYTNALSSKAGHTLTLWLGFDPVTFFLIWGGTAYLIKDMSRRRRLEDVILFTQFLIPVVGFTIVSTVVFPPMPRLIAISIAPAAILAGRFVALPISFAEKKRRLGGAAKAYLPTVGLAALITITGITGSRAYIEFNGGYHEAAEKIGSLGKGGTYVQRNGHNWRIRFNKAVYTAGSWEELARLYHQKKVRYFPVDYASRHYIWEGSRCSRCLTPSGTCRL